MNQKGNFTFMFFLMVFIITATIVFVSFTPLAQNVTITAYRMGEILINDSNESIQEIEDERILGEVEEILTQQKDNYVFQIDLLGALNKYAATIVIIFAAIIMVLISRSLVQRNQGVV